MTIPIFLSEAIPLEIRNILKSLEIGMPVRFRSDEGEISFICEEYICINVRSIPDNNSRYGYRAVNIICRQCDWDELEIEDTHFQNKKNYRGKTYDHPGNEYLPAMNKR